MSHQLSACGRRPPADRTVVCSDDDAALPVRSETQRFQIREEEASGVKVWYRVSDTRGESFRVETKSRILAEAKFEFRKSQHAPAREASDLPAAQVLHHFGIHG